jgi:type IV pilus assembly protein PilM
VVVDGSVREPEPFADACRALWGAAGFGTRSVVASLGTQDAVVRTAELPALARRDVRGALRFELADVLPFPVDDSTLDCTELDRRSDERGEEETVRYLVVAARSASVDTLADALRAAGLRPRSFDVAAFAAARVDLFDVGAGGAGDPDRTDRPAVPTAVVLEGDGLLSIAVHVGGSVRFARTLYLDQSLDDELSAMLEVELSAIEVHRGGDPTSDLPGAATARNDPISEAVTATLEHLRMTDEESAARVVHVLGTAASAGRLAAAIDVSTGLPTHVRDVRLDDEGHPLLGADLLAAGHALRVRAADPGPPWPKLGTLARSRTVHGLGRQVLGVTVATALVAAAGVMLIGPDPAGTREEADSLQRNVDTMTERMSSLELEDEQATELRRRQHLVEDVESAATDWSGILSAIEAGRPEGSSLLSVEAIGGDADAEDAGVVRLTVQATDTTAVEPWLQLLGGIDGLVDPWLEVASAGDVTEAQGLATFTLRASLEDSSGEADGG